MIKKQLIIMLISFAFAAAVRSQGADPTDTVRGNITSNVSLDSTKRYLLEGTVFIKSNGSLTIPSGTVIFGDKQTKGALVVERGGKLFAYGTADRPIVFTSELAPNLPPPNGRAAGDWGGIVILGKATINTNDGRDTASIEGITPAVYYGGHDDNDNSGVLRYVRIEYSGIALSPNNEINGLTMGGVGRGTIIEYIMVSYNGDDSYEWFGGTVNCKYLVAYNDVDDDFDVDNGYRGKLQFGLGIKSPNIADISGSHGIESDNNSAPNYNVPRTLPVFSNFSWIGPKQDTGSVVNPNHKRGFHLRRNSLTSVFNSIIMGFPDAALYDGTGVTCALQNDTQFVKSNIFAGNPGGFKSTSAGCSFNATSYSTTNNNVFALNSQVQLNNPYGGITNGNYLPAFFTPNAGSPSLSGANFTYAYLQDQFFNVTTYRGAFDQNSTWANNWTHFRPDTVNYNIPIGIQQLSSEVPKAFGLSQNYPNPFNPVTYINFSLPKAGFVTLKVYDALGREVIVLANGFQKVGSYKVNFDASNLPSGVYFYKISVSTNANDNWTQTKKMVLIK